MSDPNLFAQWLRDRRKALRLTQTELAARAGLSFSAVQKLEGGQRRPSKQVAQLLVEALNIAPKERARLLRLALGPSDAEGGEKGPATPPTNLPAQLTRLIGRDEVREKVSSFLRSDDVRLLTLTGSPGIGKTRLALGVASDLLDDFDDGVFVVTLAAVRDPALVVRSIAATFGVRDKVTEPISLTLKEYLREQKVLLVLDNFEQVVEAAPALADLLWGCPQIKMLVTSREALHVRGERQLPVPSLDDEASVQLFVERAEEVEAGFSLTRENKVAVESICSHLEGVPLAIELVAARVRLLPPRALLTRLEDHSHAAGSWSATLPLLVGGARDLPDRHRTLRSAIGWSYDLLNPAEQRLYRRLAVFVGGSTFAAAEAICNARNDLEMDVVEGLLSLLDKNLLKRQYVVGGKEERGNDEPRYIMLETIREYAAERLEESGESRSVKEWHAQFYLALARAAESQITVADQKRWLDVLEREHDNLQAALGWTLEYGDVEMGVRTACALRHFWYVHGHVQEGLQWLERAVLKAEEANVPNSLLISALNDAGWLAIARSDYERAGRWLNRSLALAREDGDPASIAASLNRLATLKTYSANPDQARPLLEEAIALQREIGDKEGAAKTLNNLGSVLLHISLLDEAATSYQESLALFRELEAKWNSAMVLGNLAHVVRRQGIYDEAEILCSQSLKLGLDIDSAGILLMTTQTCQADIARCQGNYKRAHELYKSTLQVSYKIGYDYFIGLDLMGLACLTSQTNQPERSASLLGALDALIEKGDGALILPVDKPEYNQALAVVSGALDEATFNKAWAEGRALTGDDLIDWLEESTGRYERP